MHPKKAKQLIPDVAKETGLPEDCISEIVGHYWGEVRKSLSSLAQPKIHITNLGDFNIKHWKLTPIIEGLERWEENNRLTGMQEITARFRTAETLFGLKAIREIVEQEQQRQEFIKKHKQTTHVVKRRYNKNLEKQRTDTGGNS